MEFAKTKDDLLVEIALEKEKREKVKAKLRGAKIALERQYTGLQQVVSSLLFFPVSLFSY